MSDLTDTHCHLYFKDFHQDLDQVLDRAWEEGVERILVPGIDLESSRQATALAEKYPQLYAAVGIHPNEATTWNESTLSALSDLAAHPKTVAIGEIGLDFYRDRTPKELQIEVFKQQLALAKEQHKPVIIHTRQSLAAVWPILSAWQSELEKSASALAQQPGVLHSFDESVSWAQQVIESHFRVGIGGPVTFRNATDKHELATRIDLSHLLLETDAPFLTPHPYRGRRNEPAYTAYVAAKVAELKNLPVAAVRHQTTKNAATLFNWPP